MTQKPAFFLLKFCTLVLIILFVSPGVGFADDSECSASKAKWEQIFNDIRSKLQEFSTLQQTPVERLVQRPILDRAEARTIAKQVSEALQAKEEELNNKRKECRNLINAENQAFNDASECLQNGKSSKDKDSKNIVKKRQSFIEKAVLTLAEVKEVEGRDNNVYTDNYQADPYKRSVNNYWQNYQQMYRRFWGQ